MKLITAIVRPHTLDKIIVALEEIENFPGITISDAEGFGQRLRTTTYDALNPFKAKKRLEIACADDLVELIIQAIRVSAHTGKKGDGIVLVTTVENAVLI